MEADNGSMFDATAWLSAHVEEHTTGHAADLNQYWYSASTITTIVDALREHCLPLHKSTLDCAFLSTQKLATQKLVMSATSETPRGEGW